MESKSNVVSGSRLIFGYLGYVTVLVGFITLSPLLILPFYPEESPFSACFAIPGFTAIGLGYFMTFIIRGKKRGKLYKNQNLLIVLLIWIVAIAVFAFPFFLMGKLTAYGEDFNYIQGLFEATAGITTSGFSLFRNIEAAPKLIVMYRSILLLFGGTGLIMVMTLFLGKVYGMSLFNAEGHTDRIMPHVIRTAKIIIGLYLAIIAIGVFLLWLFGMTLFDAVCFAISAVSTGGFAPKVDSLASYNSVPIEIVTIVLMLLGGTNFMALVLILKGKFKSFFTHSEVKLRIANCVIFIPMFTYFMYVAFGGTVMGNFRRSAFQVISMLTTTGLGTLDFPSFVAAVPMAMIPMLYLMFTGGGTGSTAGSVKEYRVALAIKSIWWHIRDKVDNNRKIKAEQINKFGKKVPVTKQEKNQNTVYLFMHLCLICVCTFILTFFGYSFSDSLFEVTSAFGTIGFSCGITNADMPSVVLLVQCFGMLVGRLEIYIIMLGALRACTDFKLWVRKKYAKRKDY